MNIRSIDRSLYTRLLLAGIFVLGLVLRLYCLDCYSIWYDEVASIEVAQRGLNAIFTDRFGWMNVQTPLHYFQVWLTIQPVDPTVTSFLVRLPSALAGAFTPILVYALGREIFGRAQGLLAALFMALAIVHLDYSQDVRPYTILTFLTILSIYCLVIAERTRSGRWWLAFTLVSVLNILYSYNVLTLMLPALAPYCLWLFVRFLKKGESGRRTLLYFLGSMLALALAAFPMLLDTMRVPRTPPQLSPFPFSNLIRSPMEMAVWFTQFGLGGQAELLLQAVLFLFGLLGLYFGVRSQDKRGAMICGAMILIPALILALLSTSNVVYQRYALFAMPFYLLLISNGIVSASVVGRSGSAFPTLAKVIRVSTLTTAAISLLAFAFAARVFLFDSADKPLIAIDRPDFRKVAIYLSEHAKPQDTVVYAGWDPTASNFYWKDKPPADIYSILDPRLFQKKLTGSVYWIVSYDFRVPGEMVRNDRWAEVKTYYRTIILRQDNPGSSITPGMEWFASQLESISPRTRAIEHVTLNLKGTIYGGTGQAASAASAFRAAGTFFPIGEEYLRTSKEFGKRDELSKAWRDALISKSMQPYSVELHRWMAEMLSQMGLQAESQSETQIADLLSSAQQQGRRPNTIQTGRQFQR